jgi:hypothetical protein
VRGCKLLLLPDDLVTLTCIVGLAACGGAGKVATSQTETPTNALSAVSAGPVVSSNPYAQAIDAQCARAMPVITEALQMAQKTADGSQDTFDVALLGEAAANAKALDASTYQVIEQVVAATNTDPADPAGWHAMFDGFAGSLGTMYQGASSPGLDATYVELASAIVQLRQA